MEMPLTFKALSVLLQIESPRSRDRPPQGSANNFELGAEVRTKVSWVLCGLLLFMTFSLFSCATHHSPGGTQEDELIVDEVMARLRSEPSLRQADILVDSEQGVVTLRGIVDDIIDRNLAESIVRRVEGVKSVRNWLEVRKRAPSIFFRRR